MRIDELHKFSDGTLNDVRTALNDRLKGIRMQYLPQTIWRQSDRDKAGAMIQAIDKQLKTRRIMRSLEKFIDKMDSMHSTLSMYYDYDAHVKGELLCRGTLGMIQKEQKGVDWEKIGRHEMELVYWTKPNYWYSYEVSVLVVKDYSYSMGIQKWASYQASLSTLESQIAFLMEVVSKVVPYAAIELIHIDDLGAFDLSKVEGYRPSYKKEHRQAGNNLTTATFPWLSEFVADPSTSVEVLLSKKPLSLQRPAPSKTQALVASFPKATPSSILGSNSMSPLADASVVKPLSSQFE
ncbi:hypothetical protein Tco_0156593 [Tanacetum coccineum]